MLKKEQANIRLSYFFFHLKALDNIVTWSILTYLRSSIGHRSCKILKEGTSLLLKMCVFSDACESPRPGQVLVTFKHFRGKLNLAQKLRSERAVSRMFLYHQQLFFARYRVRFLCHYMFWVIGLLTKRLQCL